MPPLRRDGAEIPDPKLQNPKAAYCEATTDIGIPSFIPAALCLISDSRDEQQDQAPERRIEL
jgi:hypothetical protein